MSRLDELGLLHGTDKSSARHDFLRKYERYLAPLADQPITLLEIGVFNGASLKMWRDYFPKARIVGCDISPAKRSHAEERIAIEIGDCGNADFLGKIAKKYGPLDFILDDGSHIWQHQQTAFSVLFDHLKPGGVFIIEDIHTSYHEKYDNGRGGPTTVEWLKQAVDYIVPGSEYARLGLKHERHVEKQWRASVSELVFLRESSIVIKRL